MHMPWFSLSFGQLRGLGPSVGARLCSDMVGDGAHTEESVASDDRQGTGHTDGGASKFGAGVVILSTKQHHPGLNIEGRDMGKQRDRPFSQN